MRVLIAGTLSAPEHPDAEVVASDFLTLWSRFGNAAFDLVISNALDLVQDWPACIENLIFVSKRLEIVSNHLSNHDLMRLGAMANWDCHEADSGSIAMARPEGWSGWKCDPRKFHPSAQDATFVLARWNEDVSWAAQYRHFIVQKDEHVPNLGREASSYLWYIVEHYDRLEGVYVFTQARPDHLDFALLRESVDRFLWLGDPRYRFNSDGMPWGLPVAQLATDLGLLVDWPARCAQGGTFAVTAKQIKTRPKSFYEKALKIALDMSCSPWLYETMWEQVFLARRLLQPTQVSEPGTDSQERGMPLRSDLLPVMQGEG